MYFCPTQPLHVTYKLFQKTCKSQLNNDLEQCSLQFAEPTNISEIDVSLQLLTAIATYGVLATVDTIKEFIVLCKKDYTVPGLIPLYYLL